MSDELTKVADDLDSFVHDMREDGNDDSALWLEQRASALRRIAAAGEQKPVAWRVKNDFGHWYVTADVALASTWQNIEKYDVQALFTAPQKPQPAPGWDDAIDPAAADSNALSPDPHIIDCEKQGSMGDISPGDPKDLQELLSTPSVWKNDTTKSEGGGQVAPAKCSATGVHPTDTSCAAEPEVAPGPSDLHASDREKQGWLAKDVEAATKRVADWKQDQAETTRLKPSDRPADVTVEELAKFMDDHMKAWMDEGDFARALLRAFTVGRR